MQQVSTQSLIGHFNEIAADLGKNITLPAVDTMVEGDTVELNDQNGKWVYTRTKWTGSMAWEMELEPCA